MTPEEKSRRIMRVCFLTLLAMIVLFVLFGDDSPYWLRYILVRLNSAMS